MDLQIFILSIITSLISSTIFIFLLLIFLRPHVKIANYISKTDINYDGRTETVHIFKIINLSWFTAYDISVKLTKLQPYQVPNGTNFRSKKLSLACEQLSCVAYYRPKWRRKNYGDYAMLFRTSEDLGDILNKDSNSVRIEITLKHGLTGLSKVVRQDYSTPGSIKNGIFKFGNDFNIE